MGALVGLAFGVGVVTMLSAFGLPSAPLTQRRVHRVRSSLDRAGLETVSVRALIFLSLASGVVVFVGMLVLSGAPPVAFAFAALAAYAPFGVVSSRARARARETAQVWPDAVDQLASGVRAGLGLPDALSSLGSRGPEELHEAFARFARDYQASGNFSACLDRLKVHLSDPVGDRVVEGLRVAREVGGGDLGRLLRHLSSQLRDDLRIRTELEARQAWAVNAARLAVSAPWLVLLLMSFNAEVISRYASTGGAVVLGIGGFLCLVAYRLMMRIGALPPERRILAAAVNLSVGVERGGR